MLILNREGKTVKKKIIVRKNSLTEKNNWIINFPIFCFMQSREWKKFQPKNALSSKGESKKHFIYYKYNNYLQEPKEYLLQQLQYNKKLFNCCIVLFIFYFFTFVFIIYFNNIFY